MTSIAKMKNVQNEEEREAFDELVLSKFDVAWTESLALGRVFQLTEDERLNLITERLFQFIVGTAVDGGLTKDEFITAMSAYFDELNTDEHDPVKELLDDVTNE